MLAFERCEIGTSKKVRMEQRVAPEAKEIIEQAARLQGVDLSEYVISHSVKAARETIQQLHATVLQPQDIAAFLAAFDDEEPNQELAKLLARHTEVVRANGCR